GSVCPPTHELDRLIGAQAFVGNRVVRVIREIPFSVVTGFVGNQAALLGLSSQVAFVVLFFFGHCLLSAVRVRISLTRWTAATGHTATSRKGRGPLARRTPLDP